MPKKFSRSYLMQVLHFGHLKRKWNPAMAPYIFMERNGIHIIDLEKTITKLDDAASHKAYCQIRKESSFVATKKTGERDCCRKGKSSQHALCYRTLARW